MHPATIQIKVPVEFDFQGCLTFLNRNTKECLHFVEKNQFIKPVLLNERAFLLTVSFADGQLNVKIQHNVPTKEEVDSIRLYLEQQFDLHTDLSIFYKKMEEDLIMRKVVKAHYGLRLLGMPDLFECLVWSVIGQQINLNFAYTLKERLVKEYGTSFLFENKKYHLFPTAAVIAELTIEDLRVLSFSNQKAKYIIGIAALVQNGSLDKSQLIQLRTFGNIKDELIKIKGVGNWTANYVAMKCFLLKNAFPIEDVGLHNAMKIQLNWDRKPTYSEIHEYAKNWEGWEAYVVFYLWRTLIL